MASAPSLLSPGRITQAFATASGAGSPAPSANARNNDAAAGAPATGRAGLVAGLGGAGRPMSAAVPSPSRAAQLATAQAVVPHTGSLWSSGPAAGVNNSATAVAGSASASSLGSLGAHQQQRRVTLQTHRTSNSGHTGANSTGQLSFQPPLPHSTDPANTGSPNSAGLDPPSRPWSLAGESSAGVHPRSAMASQGGGTGGPGGGKPPRNGSMGGNILFPMSPGRHDRPSRNGGNGLASARASRNGSAGVGPGTGAGAAAGGDGSGRGGSTSGTAAGAPAVSGGIDMGRLIAIQKLLDEWDSDEEQEPASARGSAASGHRGSEAYGRSSDLGYRGERRTSDSSGIGLRSLTSLRDRGDMHLWQPSVSVATGSVADHQQRLRERADVTQSLRRWADQVLHEAHRPDGSQRLKNITAAASTHQVDDADQADVDDDDGGGGGGGGGRAGRSSSKPDPSGVGAQLRAHFLATVAEEVNKKFEMMRSNWDEEVAVEMEELRELRVAHKDLRQQQTETKAALDKANTRLELMKSQVKSVTMIPEASVMSGPPRTSSPHAVRRSVTMHPHQHPQPHSVPLPHVPDPSDPLHDRVHNIGSRRNTNTSFAGEAPAAPGGRISPLGSRGGAGGQGAKASGGLHGGIPHDVQAQLRHQEEKAAEITKKLQAAELQIITLKQQNTKLEHDLHNAASKTAAAPPPPPPAKSAGAKAGSKPPAGGRGAKGGRPGSAAKDSGGSGAVATSGAGEVKALQGQVEGLGKELAAAREAAAARQREATAKEQEAAKLQQELTGVQHTLSAALQQLAALRDELAAAQQQGREQQQLAAAEAAAAQQQQDGASGEEVEQLVEERDAAIRLAEGLHQEVEALRVELRAMRDSALADADAGAGEDSAAPQQPPPQQQQQQQQLPADGEPSQDSEPSRADSVSEQHSYDEQDRDGQGNRGRAATTDGGVQTSPRPGYGYAHGDSFNRAWASTAPRESHGVQTSAQPTPRKAKEQEGTGEVPLAASAGGVGDGDGWAEAVEARLQERLPRVVAEAAVAMAEEHMEGVVQAGVEGAEAGAGAGLRRGTVAEEAAGEPGGEGGGEGGDGVARIAAAVERMVREQLLGLLPRAMSIFLDTHAPGILPPQHALQHATAGGPYQESGPTVAGPAGDTGSGPVPSLDLTQLPHSQQQQLLLQQQDLGPARPSQGSFVIAGTAISGPRESQVGAQVQQLASGTSDARLYVFRPRPGSAPRHGQGQGQLPVGYATSAGAAAAAAVRSMSMSPRGARSRGRGAAAGGGEREEGAGVGTGAVPSAVTVQGVMFTPLLARGGPRSTWQEQAALMEQQAPPPMYLPGGHGPTAPTPTPTVHIHHLPASHHTQQPQQPQQPHHGHVSVSVPEKERGGMDTMVSVSLPNGRHTLVSVATARRRKSAFAALHSTYLAPVRDGSPPRDARAGEGEGWESDGQGQEGAGDGEHGWEGRSAGAAGSGTASARALRLAAEGAMGGAGGLHGDAGGRSGSPPDAAARMQQQQQQQQGLVLRRPQSAAARAYESLRQQQQVVSEQGQARPRRPATATVITGALRSAGMAGAPTFAAAAAAGQQQELAVEGPRGGSPGRDVGWGGGERGEGSPPRAAGARARPLTANPQKGIQLPAHLRALRHTGWSAGAAAGSSPAWGAADAPPPAAATTATVLPGMGISRPFTEIQLHTGRDAAAVTAAAAAGTGHASPRERTEAHWPDTGGAVQLPYALPPAVPPLLLGQAQPPLMEEGPAADVAAVQQAAERELAEAEEVRRELAEEVAASRQQWLDEARRARALEAELQSLRQLLQGAAPRY